MSQIDQSSTKIWKLLSKNETSQKLTPIARSIDKYLVTNSKVYSRKANDPRVASKTASVSSVSFHELLKPHEIEASPAK